MRCVPPENRPLGGEVNACRRFLLGELTAAPPPVIMPPGAIAHASVLRALALPASRFAFRHGLTYAIPSGRALAPSYHCSRYNLNTGRLTPAMFEQVFARVRALVDAACSGTSRATPRASTRGPRTRAAREAVTRSNEFVEFVLKQPLRGGA